MTFGGTQRQQWIIWMNTWSANCEPSVVCFCFVYEIKNVYLLNTLHFLRLVNKNHYGRRQSWRKPATNIVSTTFFLKLQLKQERRSDNFYIHALNWLYRRFRSPAFNKKETCALLQLIEKYKVVILNKSVTSAVCQAKDAAWTKIAKEFNKMGR